MRPISLLLAPLVLAASLLLAPDGLAQAPPTSPGGAILALDGCDDATLPPNDDGSTGFVPLAFAPNFFGATYGGLYVNNNGNVTFDAPLSTYTPFGLAGASRVIVAPFFADVDTRGVGSSPVTYGAATFGSRPAFCVNWVNVGYYSGHTDKLVSAQLLLVDRSDVAAGDFDIVMNYDRVQWETGDASGGSGGLGGSPVRVGYSNGSTTSFELPGSGTSGSFLDAAPTALRRNSRSSLQPGRYVYEVRNGTAPVGGTIAGGAYRDAVDPGNALSGALVQVCGSGGGCIVSTTNVAGQYSVSGLVPDGYTIRAFGPAGTSLSPGTFGPVAITGSETVGDADLVLTGPSPLPAGTDITNIRLTPDGIPVVYWGTPLELVSTGCTGGTASYEVIDESGVAVRSGAMTEGPDGTFTGVIAPLRPTSGRATVHVTIACPGGGVTNVVFDVYIDPSGFVRTVAGDPIAGATVTLFRSDASTGPFEIVPDGSAVMSPSNRTNPDQTDAEGHFGWDVVAGFYLVRAERAGCVAPGDPTRGYVETDVLTIPPPVTDLDLRLDCDGTPATSTTTITTTTTSSSSTTSSTAPNGCSYEPTLPAIRCRAQELASAVQAAGLPAGTEGQLLHTIDQADQWLGKAEQLTGTRRDRALRAAGKRFTRAFRRLTSLTGRRQIPDGVRMELADRVSELMKSIALLRSQP
jgi:hypothetical protein